MFRHDAKTVSVEFLCCKYCASWDLPSGTPHRTVRRGLQTPFPDSRSSGIQSCREIVPESIKSQKKLQPPGRAAAAPKRQGSKGAIRPSSMADFTLQNAMPCGSSCRTYRRSRRVHWSQVPLPSSPKPHGHEPHASASGPFFGEHRPASDPFRPRT